ncbi:MAG: glycosyltransferase family 2 protein [Treponema sp.]|nr:glycosyltransferase family 2 protein [Treponema sp.]
MKYGFVVPVYNHGSTLESVVQNLSGYNLPVIVVDDGNDQENKAFIQAVEKKFPQVTLVTRKKNGGKGKAMNDGILKASEMGLTHVLQIDSDGQHDANRVKAFLEISEKNPQAVICGYPEYDANAPKSRVNGRKFANGWVHFVTLSKEIKDAMIGFRIYPVAPYCSLIKKGAFLDGRMGYDIDVLVHLSWKGLPIISESVKVSYPKDGVSNFRMVRDNLRIALTYARLCLGMFIRFPLILVRNAGKKRKYAIKKD